MSDKFKLYKSKRFKVSLRHNVPIEFVEEKKEAFTHKLDCGCIDEYNPGWYVWRYFFGYSKLEDI